MLRPLQAINKHCFGCSGDSYDEATLCWSMDCPLWRYRLGLKPSSPRYFRRVQTVWEKGGDRVRELVAQGLKQEDFLRETMRNGVFRGKRHVPARSAKSGKPKES